MIVVAIIAIVVAFVLLLFGFAWLVDSHDGVDAISGAAIIVLGAIILWQSIGYMIRYDNELTAKSKVKLTKEVQIYNPNFEIIELENERIEYLNTETKQRCIADIYYSDNLNRHIVDKANAFCKD